MSLAKNDGLFIPLHFRSWERKVHRENFRSRGTFIPWNIRSLELSFLGSERSKNFRSLELSFLWNFHSLRTNVPRSFSPIVKKRPKAVAVTYVH